MNEKAQAYKLFLQQLAAVKKSGLAVTTCLAGCY